MATDDAFTDQLAILRVWASVTAEPYGSSRSNQTWIERFKEYLAQDGMFTTGRLIYDTFDDGPTFPREGRTFIGIPNLLSESYGEDTTTLSDFKTSPDDIYVSD